MRLLVTRPRPEAERTAARLRGRGHTVVAAPLLGIETVAASEIGGGRWAAILVTSAKAAPAIAAQQSFASLRLLPVFAVGERSARAMREIGFAEVTSAGGDVRALARLVTERLRHCAAPLLYLAAAERSGDLAGDLAACGFLVHTAVVYRAVAATDFPPAAAKVLAEGLDGVLHFSRRSAEAYVNAARAASLHAAALQRPKHFCLSARVAEPLAEAGAADVRIAAQPTEAALIALIPEA